MLVYHRIGLLILVKYRSGGITVSVSPQAEPEVDLRLLVPPNTLVGEDNPFPKLYLKEAEDRFEVEPDSGCRDESGWTMTYSFTRMKSNAFEVSWPGTQERTFIELRSGELAIIGQDTFIIQLVQPPPV